MKVVGKLLIIILFVLAYSNPLFSQDSISHDSLNTSLVVKKNTEQKPVFTPKLHFGMDFGAGYIVGSGIGSGSYTSWAPSLSYTATQKLTLEFGGVLFRGPSLLNYNSRYAVSLNQNLNQNSNTFFLYTSGQYALTKKITLSGTVYKTINPYKNSALNPNTFDLNGADLGLNYQINKNFSIGAQFRYSNSNNPFYMYDNFLNPYSSPWNRFNTFNNGLNRDF